MASPASLKNPEYTELYDATLDLKEKASSTLIILGMSKTFEYADAVTSNNTDAGAKIAITSFCSNFVSSTEVNKLVQAAYKVIPFGNEK